MEQSRRGFLELTGAAALSAMSARAAAGDDPLGVRKDFPALGEGTFLNTAYIGLTPQPVIDAARDWVEARARHPYLVGEMEKKKHEARALFAEMAGAKEEEIGFLFSTSEGENLVVNSLDFRPGDNVVFDDLVYPSTAVIYRRLQETHGVEMRVAPHTGGAAGVTDFAKYVDKRTRIVSVAWTSNTSGYLHDIKGLADLAHAHGAYLYADAAQFVGTAPLDAHALGIDFFTTGTYKWLLAGFGIAPFYVKEELLDRIKAPNVGWMVRKTLPGNHFEHYKDARKFEFSSPTYGQFYDLAAGLRYLKGIGLDRIEAQSVGLAQQLRKGLAERGFPIFTPEWNRSPIISFFVKKPEAEIQAALDAAQIKVSLHAEENEVRVRVAPAFFNNATDVDRFLAAVERFGT